MSTLNNRSGAQSLGYPSIFIGSSGDGLGIARNLAEVLRRCRKPHYQVALWAQYFRPGKITLNQLVDASKTSDLAVMILTPDDIVTKKGKEGPGARDNVIFEAGLFIGSIQPERTILVRLKSDGIDLLSDLGGFTWSDFKWPITEYKQPEEGTPARLDYDRNMQAVLQKSVCVEIAKVLNEQGKRAFSSHINHLSSLVREIEKKYQLGQNEQETDIIHQLFHTHISVHLDRLNSILARAKEGQLLLTEPERKVLPKLILLAKNRVCGVAHYRNIRWWTRPEGEGRAFLDAHEALRGKAQRVFLLPVSSLDEPEVKEAIEMNCKKEVDVRILIWRTGREPRTLRIDGKEWITSKLGTLKHNLERDLGQLRLPGGEQDIVKELSFLIIDDILVSDSNVKETNLSGPSRLFTNRAQILEFQAVFNILIKDAWSIPAQVLYPSFCS